MLSFLSYYSPPDHICKKPTPQNIIDVTTDDNVNSEISWQLWRTIVQAFNIYNAKIKMIPTKITFAVGGIVKARV
jgi:hypothetical protein